MSPDICEKRVPDFAQQFILRNELAAFTDFDDQQWINLLEAVKESTEDVIKVTVEHTTAGQLYNLLRGDGETPAWKYALYGGAFALGGLALFKLLK